MLLALLAPAGLAHAQDALGNGRALDGGLLSAPGGRFNQQVRPIGVLISSRVGSGLPSSITGLDQASRELSFSTSPLRQQDLLRQRAAESGLIYVGPTGSRTWEQTIPRSASLAPSSASSSRLSQPGFNPRASAPIGSALDDIPQPGEALLARPASAPRDLQGLDASTAPSQLSPSSPLDAQRFRASPIDGLRRLDGRDRPESLATPSPRLDDPLAPSRQPNSVSRLPSVLQLPASTTPMLTRPGAVPMTPSQERLALQNLPRDPSIPMTPGELREVQLAPRPASQPANVASRPASISRPTLIEDLTPQQPPTLADLRDGSRPLSARIENREETRQTNRLELRSTDEQAPGRATGFDPFGPTDLSQTLARMREAEKAAATPPPVEPLVLRPVAGRRGMELAVEALAAGKFVSAESLFAAESWKDARDFAAVLGQVHSAAAAGMLASTGLILADAYTREERLIGYPIEPSLLMPASRVDEIASRLVDEINKRRDGYAGVLLAHLGYVHNRPEWITQGLASVEESSEARLQLLAPKLRAGWLK